MFVYEPSLLWIGDWRTVATSCISASLGVVCLAAALQGSLWTELKLWQRIALFAAALLLIKPGLITDAIGLALLASVVVAQKLRRGVDRDPAVVDAVASDARPLERQ
jgi:TRAP-type uncharacterized transport system fused permease subunit